MPAISVIVPNYNHALYLRQRIDSILAQTCQDFELILLDDASTDESREILSEYLLHAEEQAGTSATRRMPGLDLRVDFNEANSGSPFKQWNRGVRMARGKYVWIAESDDYAEPRFLERLVSALEADPKTTLAYCRSRRLTDDGVKGFADYNLPDPTRWTADFCVDGAEFCRQYFALITPIPNASSVVFRKDSYDRVGGADENLRLCGDWKLWAALALVGKVVYLSDPMNYFRYHANTARGRTERARLDVAEYLHVSRWVLDRVTVPEAELKKICAARAKGWVPLLMSFRVSLDDKRALLKSVRSIDPHPLRRVLLPGLATVHRKIERHWRDIRSLIATVKT
jgi:glycosyltransferase involved in cell wall biosynthesis